MKNFQSRGQENANDNNSHCLRYWVINENWSKIASFTQIIKKLRRTIVAEMTTPTPIKNSFFTPCLGLIEDIPVKVEKENLVVFAVKVKAGGPATSSTYKLAIRRIEEGTPAEFILIIKKSAKFGNRTLSLCQEIG